jgi:hypothetical protein
MKTAEQWADGITGAGTWSSEDPTRPDRNEVIGFIRAIQQDAYSAGIRWIARYAIESLAGEARVEVMNGFCVTCGAEPIRLYDGKCDHCVELSKEPEK